MAQGISTFKHPPYLQNSLALMLFFASWGVWWSFFQIWLTDTESGLGLNGSQVGTIYAANSAGTLAIMLLYGMIQDKLQIKRHLVIFASAIMTLIGPFAIWVYRPLLEDSFFIGVFAGAIVLSAGFMAAAGLLEAFSERLSRTHKYEYGQARMWGSVGYAIAALMAGFLFTKNPELNFWFGSAFGLLCLLVQVFWKSPPPLDSSVVRQETTPRFSEIMTALYSPQMGAMILFVLLSWTFYTVFDQQMFPQFYIQLFESSAQGQHVYGLLNSTQVFLEAAMFGLVPILMRNVGVKTTLMLGILIMFLRILGSAVFQDPIIISFIKLLHAPEVALCILSIFRYFTLHFNPVFSATMYMVGFQIASQVGNIILSPVLGALRDNIGYQPTFYVIAGIVMLAGIYGILILKRDDQHVEGDPFVRNAHGGNMIKEKA